MRGTDDKRKQRLTLSLTAVETLFQPSESNPNLAISSNSLVVISVGSMGEEDLSKKNLFPPDSEVALFWNLEDYPITTSTANLESIYANFVSALGKMNFDGSVLVVMFGDKLDLFECDPEKAAIYYVPKESDKIDGEIGEVGENAADGNMALEIVTWAAAGRKLNILVLAKQKPESEVYRVLRILKSRKFNVFVLQEPPADSTSTSTSTAENLFRSADSIVASTQVFEG